MVLQTPLSVDEDALDSDTMPDLSPGQAGLLVLLGEAAEEGRTLYFEHLHAAVRQPMSRKWLIRRSVYTTEVLRHGMMYKLHEVELTARGRLWYNRFCDQANKGKR